MKHISTKLHKEIGRLMKWEILLLSAPHTAGRQKQNSANNYNNESKQILVQKTILVCTKIPVNVNKENRKNNYYIIPLLKV